MHVAGPSYRTQKDPAERGLSLSGWAINANGPRSPGARPIPRERSARCGAGASPWAPMLGPWHDHRTIPCSAKETGMAAPASVDAYLAACPDDSRVALEHLRAMIMAAAPEATETISYQMPAFRAYGRMLVWMGAFRDHCSLFPGSMALIEAHKDELAGYRIAKGTIQFRPDKPLPAGTGSSPSRCD